MSLPSSPDYGGFVAPPQKQPYNVYTVMLVISFLAMVTGSVLMHLELQKFGKDFPPWKTPGAIPAVPN